MAAYFGLLRLGELTADPHAILAKNVHLGENKNKILFILESSKTHGKDKKPQLVKISSRAINEYSANKRKNYKIYQHSTDAEPTLCAYTILREFLRNRHKETETMNNFLCLLMGHLFTLAK